MACSKLLVGQQPTVDEGFFIAIYLRHHIPTNIYSINTNYYC